MSIFNGENQMRTTQLQHTRNHLNGRQRNCTSTVTIQITVTAQVNEALEKIAATGLFGANRSAAAERLMTDKIRELLRDGLIQKAKKALE